MIDVHAHFADEGYEFPEEWEKIMAVGVKRVILAGDSLSHCLFHRDFANAHAGCYFTIGLHPERADREFSEELEALSSIGREEKCVAVGEIGLDYHYPDFPKREQWELFGRQLALADELGLPVQIHSRDACADTLAILRERKSQLGGGFLMHCYSYGREETEHFSELGAYFSFGGVICFKNARRAVESVEALSLSQILSETDSPYLSPLRGEKNSPSNIPLIVAKLAQIKGVAVEEMIAAIDENAKRLFQKLK